MCVASWFSRSSRRAVSWASEQLRKPVGIAEVPSPSLQPAPPSPKDMFLSETLERPQRAALELHEAFAFAGTAKLCPRADAFFCQPGTESWKMRTCRRTSRPWPRPSDIPPPSLWLAVWALGSKTPGMSPSYTAVRYWKPHLNFLSLSFLICKNGYKKNYLLVGTEDFMMCVGGCARVHARVCVYTY